MATPTFCAKRFEFLTQIKVKFRSYYILVVNYISNNKLFKK